MDNDKVIPIGFVILGVFGVILFGVLFYKLITEILNTSIHFAGWFITTVEFALVAVAMCAAFVVIILLLVAIIWSIKKLAEQTATAFSQLLKKKPERILPLFIAVVSQTLILMLSKEFTTSDTKKLLSLMLYIILAILLITTSRQNKKIWGGLVIVMLVLLTSWLLQRKYQIMTWSLFADFVRIKFQTLLDRPLFDMFSIALILVAFICLIGISLFYSFKKV